MRCYTLSKIAYVKYDYIIMTKVSGINEHALCNVKSIKKGSTSCMYAEKIVPQILFNKAVIGIHQQITLRRMNVDEIYFIFFQTNPLCCHLYNSDHIRDKKYRNELFYVRNR